MIVWLTMCLMVVLALQPLGAAAKTPQQAQAPLPTIAGNVAGGDVSISGSVGSDPGGSPGTWYIGATPPNVDYTKPVLLFVHGKGGWAGSWWNDTVYHGHNDMYDYAYNNGYRTAFVDLYPDHDMWDNGYLLSQLVNTITAYFGVSKVDIIAHSKGGVDSDAALYYYGANPKVRRVVTLGTPHWGTPIADMAYSGWTWWIAALMGELNDATYVMQTGYMSSFRSWVDETQTAPFYTLSGYKCGPIGTALWYSCAFIGGEDDGLVGVNSAQRPSSTHLKTGYWDHDEIRMGSRTWSYFAPTIRYASTGTTPAVAWASDDLLAAANSKSDVTAGGKAAAFPNAILRGGSTTGDAASAFPLEKGVRSATFTFIATSADFTATLNGPAGASYTVTMEKQMGAADIFPGAYLGTVTVDAPAAGSWSIDTAAAQETGWFMMAGIDSDLKATLDVGANTMTPGAARGLSIAFSGATPASSQAEVVVSGRDRQAMARAQFSKAGSLLKATVAPAESGVHTASVTVTGTLPDGSSFERSLVKSFATLAPGQTLK